MTTFLLSLVVILASVAGLGIGVICGRTHSGGGCSRALDGRHGCRACFEVALYTSLSPLRGSRSAQLQDAPAIRQKQ
jgi:hypothetical protein